MLVVNRSCYLLVASVAPGLLDSNVRLDLYFEEIYVYLLTDLKYVYSS